MVGADVLYGALWVPPSAMGKSSGTSSSASMLAEPPGLCRDRKSDTSMIANPSVAGGGRGSVAAVSAKGKV